MNQNMRYLFMSRWELLKYACQGDRIAKCCLIIHRSLDWSESEHPRGEGGKFKYNGGSSSSATTGHKRKDVTSEYQKSAKPGKGAVTMRAGYKVKGHQSEIKTANWLRDTFGGDVELIPESHISGEKRPDMFWRDQNWEVKEVSSVSAADYAVRKALKQIGNQGGIIIRCPASGVSVEKAQEVIDHRIQRSSKGKIDVILLQGEKLIGISRNKE